MLSFVSISELTDDDVPAVVALCAVFLVVDLVYHLLDPRISV